MLVRLATLAAAGAFVVRALAALEKTFGRVQALWKPVATEEAFEIVRRRLFEPVRDAKVRDTVCRAFADAYVQEGTKVPAETQESRYFDRLVQAYPIHPEVFDRLYEDFLAKTVLQRGWNRLLEAIDRYVVDGAVNGSATVARFVSQQVRVAQTGQLKTYGLAFGLGLVILVAAVFTANPL